MIKNYSKMTYEELISALKKVIRIDENFNIHFHPRTSDLLLNEEETKKIIKYKIPKAPKQKKQIIPEPEPQPEPEQNSDLENEYIKFIKSFRRGHLDVFTIINNYNKKTPKEQKILKNIYIDTMKIGLLQILDRAKNMKDELIYYFSKKDNIYQEQLSYVDSLENNKPKTKNAIEKWNKKLNYAKEELKTNKKSMEDYQELIKRKQKIINMIQEKTITEDSLTFIKNLDLNTINKISEELNRYSQAEGGRQKSVKEMIIRNYIK